MQTIIRLLPVDFYVSEADSSMTAVVRQSLSDGVNISIKMSGKRLQDEIHSSIPTLGVKLKPFGKFK